jgi:hypothetical protein
VFSTYGWYLKDTGGLDMPSLVVVADRRSNLNNVIVVVLVVDFVVDGLVERDGLV